MITVKALLELNTVQMEDYNESGLVRYRKYLREKLEYVRNNEEEVDCMTINEYYNSLPQYSNETLVRIGEVVDEDYATEYECCDYNQPEKMFAITKQNASIRTTQKIKQYYHIGKDGLEVIDKEILLKKTTEIVWIKKGESNNDGPAYISPWCFEWYTPGKKIAIKTCHNGYWSTEFFV